MIAPGPFNNHFIVLVVVCEIFTRIPVLIATCYNPTLYFKCISHSVCSAHILSSEKTVTVIKENKMHFHFHELTEKYKLYSFFSVVHPRQNDIHFVVVGNVIIFKWLWNEFISTFTLHMKIIFCVAFLFVSLFCLFCLFLFFILFCFVLLLFVVVVVVVFNYYFGFWLFVCFVFSLLFFFNIECKYIKLYFSFRSFPTLAQLYLYDVINMNTQVK